MGPLKYIFVRYLSRHQKNILEVFTKVPFFFRAHPEILLLMLAGHSLLGPSLEVMSRALVLDKPGMKSWLEFISCMTWGKIFECSEPNVFLL